MVEILSWQRLLLNAEENISLSAKRRVVTSV